MTQVEGMRSIQFVTASIIFLKKVIDLKVFLKAKSYFYQSSRLYLDL